MITSIGEEFHYENSLMWYNKQEKWKRLFILLTV